MSATIPGLSASLRRASFSAGLLRAAAAAVGVMAEIGLVRDLPLPAGDPGDAQGPPVGGRARRRGLRVADGLLPVTPDYNTPIPGVLRNAIDRMSPGPAPTMFAARPVAAIGAPPGGFGTMPAQNPLRRFCGGREHGTGPRSGSWYLAPGGCSTQRAT